MTKMTTDGSKIAKSSLWLTGNFAVERLAQLLAQVVLARLLSPQEFGIWAIVLLITRLSEQFKEQATTTVLIYRGLEDKKLVNAVYSLTLNISLAMFIVQVIAGFFVANFFEQPLVWQLNAGAALVFLIGAGAGSHGAVLQRQMKFKEIAIADGLAGIVRFGSAIAAAFLGYGVWSFVIGEIAMTIVLAVLRRWFSQYSFKYHLFPDPIAVKEVRGYMSNIIGVNLAVYANTNSDNLLIGKLINTTALGYYNIAYQLAMLPAFALSKINQINFSVLSQKNSQEQKKYLSQILEVYAVFYSLVYGVAFVVAPWLIPLVYGAEWTPAVVLFQILLFFAYARGLMSILGTVLNALNKPDINAKINWLLVPLSVPAFWLGAKLQGVEGVAIAASLVMGIGATIWFYLVTFRVSGWPIEVLIKPIIIPMLAILVAIKITELVPEISSIFFLLQPLILAVIYFMIISIFSAGKLPFKFISMAKKYLFTGS